MKNSIVLFVLLSFTLLSCKKKEVVSQATADETTIKKYIADNNLNATATGSGLYYVMTTTGTGIQPSASSKVTVNYKGYLTNGSVFDQSASSGATFSLTSVITGWQEGIQLFRKGGKGILLIPSALGYGSTATGSIPANSVLIFDIDLINVQ